ncbi:VapE domain-containing protein [Vallitalea pronyensis]|uniref:VapE domain-containing protein n=1 Tax=Vallitalea pronyensis TaxID=1348613 RepID=UPI001BAF5C72|nr:VapE domain-containing protein [Vallitalea pronyensis]
MRVYLEEHWGVSGVQKIRDGWQSAINKEAFHPIKDYINSLEWDGIKRVDTLFIDYLGVKDDKYTRAVTRKTIVACISRVLQPGCKFDYVLTLVGNQGTGKSTIIRKLGKDWSAEGDRFIKY